jgi:hypothetical protein
MWVFMRGDVVMRLHNMFCFYAVFGVVRCADSAENTHIFNSVILTGNK